MTIPACDASARCLRPESSQPYGLRSIIVKSLTFLLLHKTVVANRFAPWYHEIGKFGIYGKLN